VASATFGTPTATAIPTSTAAPLPAGSVDDTGFIGRLGAPLGLIAIVVIAGILLARLRGGKAAPVPADAAAYGPSVSSAAEAAEMTALSDPVAPFLQPLRPSPQPEVPPVETGARGEHDEPQSAGTADPTSAGTTPQGTWANARTISIHVEQLDSDDQ
jgi:hypothetical protein